MHLKGYEIQEGTVKETKGRTIWLTQKGKDVPITAGHEAEHVRPGDQVRVLFSPRNGVVRLYNKNTDRVYVQDEGKAPDAHANREALRLAIMLGLPVLGLVLGFFFLLSMLNQWYLQGNVPKPLRGRLVRSLMKTTLLYFLPWVVFGLLMGVSSAKNAQGPIAWSLMGLVLFGPGLIVYFGMKRIFALEAEYADLLTRMIKAP